MSIRNIQKFFLFIGIYVFFVPFFSFAQDAWDPGSYSGFGLPEGTLWGIVYAFMLWILSLISLIAVIAFVISGMQYLLSAGNEKTIESAKRHMIWSIVGVIVAISGLVILRAAYTWLWGIETF